MHVVLASYEDSGNENAAIKGQALFIANIKGCFLLQQVLASGLTPCQFIYKLYKSMIYTL